MDRGGDCRACRLRRERAGKACCQSGSATAGTAYRRRYGFRASRQRIGTAAQRSKRSAGQRQRQVQFSQCVSQRQQYSVSVKASPSSPVKQTCKVDQGSGRLPMPPSTISSSLCTTVTFAVGGTVSGLSGKGPGKTDASAQRGERLGHRKQWQVHFSRDPPA